MWGRQLCGGRGQLCEGRGVRGKTVSLYQQGASLSVGEFVRLRPGVRLSVGEFVRGEFVSGELTGIPQSQKHRPYRVMHSDSAMCLVLGTLLVLQC